MGDRSTNQDRELRRWTVDDVRSFAEVGGVSRWRYLAAVYSTHLEPWSWMSSPIHWGRREGEPRTEFQGTSTIKRRPRKMNQGKE